MSRFYSSFNPKGLFYWQNRKLYKNSDKRIWTLLLSFILLSWRIQYLYKSANNPEGKYKVHRREFRHWWDWNNKVWWKNICCFLWNTSEYNNSWLKIQNCNRRYIFCKGELAIFTEKIKRGIFSQCMKKVT